MKRWLWLWVLAACDLPDVSAEGKHVRVAADPGLELCGGTLAHMDEFVARTSSAFGLTAPTGEQRLVFYWLEDGDFFARSGCPEGSGGCERDRYSFAPDLPLDHELVHAVAESFGGGKLPLFAEGLAVTFEGLGHRGASGGGLMPYDPWGRPIEPLNPPSGPRIDDILLARDPLAHPDFYATAGAFTSHLIERHGLTAYLRMYATVDYWAGRDDVDAAFRAAFGAPLAQAIGEFAARPPCIGSAASAKLSECGAPELAWDGVELELHRTVGCAQDDVIGPFSGHDVVVLQTIVVPADGTFELAVIGDDDGSAVALQQCGGCPATSNLSASVDGSPATATLTAGRYSLRLLGPAPEFTSIGFRLRRVDDP